MEDETTIEDNIALPVKKFKKTAKQIEATKLLISNAMDIMFFGGGRSGKTFLFVRSIFIRALKVKSNHAIFRFRFNHVKQSIFQGTIPKVIDLCFPDIKDILYDGINKSDTTLEFPNKSMLYLGGLDDKDRTEKILGNEFSTIFLNEVTQISLDSILIAKTRLAEKNELKKRMYYDMNPPAKKHWTYKMFIEKKNPVDGSPLADPDDCVSILMNPMDNLENIDKNYIKVLDSLPERQKKRFKLGEFQEEAEGKVFKEKWIKRLWELPIDLKIVVAIDPAISHNEDSDEYGITVCGRYGDFGILIADLSDQMTPDEMANTALDAFDEYGAQEIIVESNNGGDHLETVIKHNRQFAPVRQIRASKGKVKRAIPVAHLYEKGLISHYGVFEKLEDEMMIFDEDETKMKGFPSPNRVDSMVWGFASLFDLDEVEPKLRYV